MEIFAQDIQFSQFYAPALYVNPGFAGSTHYDRIILHQRVQWPALDAKYLTSLVSFDRYFDKYKSGLGIMAIQDFQGANTISSSEVYMQYSYELGLSDNAAIRPGVQLGYLSRYIDYSKLRYPDQFTDKGQSGQATHDPNFGKQRTGMADVSSGAIFYSKKIWVSYAGHHLNNPNQSFWNGESKLPLRHTITAGYKIPLVTGEDKHHMGHMEDKVFIIPTAVYKLQGKSDQVDVGFYGYFNEFAAGVWYRGIPVKKYEKNLHNNESVVFLAGWRIKQFRINYSFDFIVSKLTPAKTFGSHEIHIALIFKGNRKLKPQKVLPCPEL